MADRERWEGDREGGREEEKEMVCNLLSTHQTHNMLFVPMNYFEANCVPSPLLPPPPFLHSQKSSNIKFAFHVFQ